MSSDGYVGHVERDEQGRPARLVFTRAQPEAQATVNGAETAFLSAVPLYAVCLCGCGGTFPAGGRRRYYSDRCRLTAWATKQAKTARQRALPGESRVERAFAAWIDTAPGRYVEAEVARLAREDRAAGDRCGEINLYLALVRRISRHLTLDAQGYRCNNSHRSLLARRLMDTRPELAGFFEIRDLRGRVA